MTASTPRFPNSVTSRERQPSAERTRSKRSRSIKGIVTSSASTPRFSSSWVRRWTCRSAPPPENGDCTAATRTRGAFTFESAGGGRSRLRDPTDHGVILRAEEHRVQARVVLRALLESVAGRYWREEFDAKFPEPGRVAEKAERFGWHRAHVRGIEIERV